MKIRKLLSFMAIALMVVAVSCSDDKKGEEGSAAKSDGATFADMDCNLRGLQGELKAAYESEDEAKITEVSEKIEKLETEMYEFADKMEKKYDGDKKADDLAREDYEKALKACKNEEVDMSFMYEDTTDDIEYLGGVWSDVEREAFMENCVAGLVDQPSIDGDAYCACMLAKLETVFSNAIEAQSMDMNEMQEWALECLK